MVYGLSSAAYRRRFRREQAWPYPWSACVSACACGFALADGVRRAAKYYPLHLQDGARKQFSGAYPSIPSIRIPCLRGARSCVRDMG